MKEGWLSDKCKKCKFCHWHLDGAGDDIEYSCSKNIPFLDSLYCTHWEPKENETNKYIKW